MSNIQCTNTGTKIRLKRMNIHRTMANATATIIGHRALMWDQYNIVS